jgi:TRAP-type C4-dicarboxylate transport system permease small subunit
MTFLMWAGDRLARVQLHLAGLAVLAILLNISVDVAMRAFFNASFSATTELVSYYYMIPVAFLPIMTLELKGGHIDTDLFYRLFPEPLKRVSRCISGIISVGIYGLLAYFTFVQAVSSTKSGEVAMGVNLLLIWPVRWVLPVVFALAAAAAFLVSVQYVLGARRHD